MNDTNRKSIRQLFEEGTPIIDAINKGIAQALRRHKLLGESIVVWQDGQVVHLSADQIPDLPLDKFAEKSPPRVDSPTGGE